MQNLEDLRNKLFFESRNIIETLAKIASPEELLSKKDLVEELNERISFLKLLEKNEEYFVIDSPLQQNDNQSLSSGTTETFLEADDQNKELEEEVIFTNELNEIDKDEIEEEVSEKPVEENRPEETPVFTNEEVQEYSEKIAENVEKTDEEIETVYESKRQIVEFEKHESVKDELPDAESLAKIQEKHAEKGNKFKLANIKGLKSVQSLFDDDPLENIEEENTEPPKATNPESGSLLKTNISTDFMEAEKPKPEFRLDLNDKIAFSQSLFSGSQADLNDAIRNLNSFKTLEEAKEYLSDLYYERNWKKADEYAQRLWTLVENKFM